jgi:hypothetical protein
LIEEEEDNDNDHDETAMCQVGNTVMAGIVTYFRPL